MTTKIAIIGCGAISEKWHLPAAVELLGAENVSIVDRDAQRLETMAREFGVNSTASNLSEIGGSLDAILIATPPHVHPSIAQEAFDNGLNVLCEKPLANTFTECKQIVKAANTSQKVLGVCHTYRFFPNRGQLRNMVLSGELGEIQHVDIQHGNPANWPTISGYSFQKELVPGGVLLIEGIHSLDFILWCFGAPKAFNYIDDSIGGIESNAQLTCEYDPAFNVEFRISRTCSLANKIIVKGTKLTAELDIYDMVKLKIMSTNKISTIECGGGKDNFNTIGVTQLENFILSTKEKANLMCNGLDGALVIEFIESCYKAKKSRPLPNKAHLPGIMW